EQKRGGLGRARRKRAIGKSPLRTEGNPAWPGAKEEDDCAAGGALPVVAPEAGGEDAHGFAIFGDGPAGDLDVPFGEDIFDLFVAERLVGRFALDQVGDHVLDRFVRDRLAVPRLIAGSEEKLEFEDA